MLKRRPIFPPEYLFPIDDWRLIQTQFRQELLDQTETIFSTSNGYLGIRGALEEGQPGFQNGTFINGFYETWPIVYGEDAYGFARRGQTIVNVPDAKLIRLYVDDEPFYLPTAHLLNYERVLDMRRGFLERHVIWEMASQKQVEIRSRRLVSLPERHVAAISYEVTVLNASAPIVLVSEIKDVQDHPDDAGDPRRFRGFQGRVLVPQKIDTKGNRLIFGYKTKQSHMTLACSVDHIIDTECAYSANTSCTEDSGKLTFTIQAEPGQTFRIWKFISYHTSRRRPAIELCDQTEWTLDRVMANGFDNLLQEQETFLGDFWDRSDVRVESEHPRALQCIRWNLFQLFQAAARAEGAGIPAKGLTAQGYEGHYFWDMEIYVLPFLIYTTPHIAHNLLKFRYSMLDKARQRAADVNQKGALFPWRTISGDEASAYYAAGTAQYHINADIMYSLRKYVEATGDWECLQEFGAEMLVETARLWYDLGFFSENHDGQFCINKVTGPDEYTTVVNNNTFTNLMARENLRFAATTVEWIEKENSREFKRLVHRTHLDPQEVEQWKEAAEKMYFPYNEKRGIHLQDEDFLDLKPWDLAKTPTYKFPLLLNYHPLVIYRHRVIKQADLVLAMLLLGNQFSLEQKKRNFEFYDPLTTGDSSLSSCIQCILAAEIGQMEKAFEYFVHSALMDLGDVAGNVRDGCHIASIGGTWMSLVYGFAGMRDYRGHLSFHPHIDGSHVKRLRFPLTIQGRILDIDLTREQAIYCLRRGEDLEIHHRDQKLVLKAGQPVTVKH